MNHIVWLGIVVIIAGVALASVEYRRVRLESSIPVCDAAWVFLPFFGLPGVAVIIIGLILGLFIGQN